MTSSTHRFALLFALVFFAPASFGQLVCTNDTQGANDVGGSGQSDLTQLCVDSSGLDAMNMGTFDVRVSWDKTRYTGANTGDACILFDQDGDPAGNADFAVCLEIGGGSVNTDPDPTAQLVGSPIFYSCSGQPDRCGMRAVFSPTSGDTGCVGDGLTFGTDPFPSGEDFPNDSVVTCTISTDDLPADYVRINVCSYNSAQPNSNPVDCTSYVGGGFVDVTKLAVGGVDPDTTDFTFNVTGSGTEGGQDVVVNETYTITGNTTRRISLPQGGPYTITEETLSGWTLTTPVCDQGTTSTGSVSGITVTASSVTECTFLNVGAGTIIIEKDAVPADGTDFAFTTPDFTNFSLDVDDDPTLDSMEILSPGSAGSYTITETPASGFTLTDITCEGDEDGGPTIELGSNRVTIDYDDGEGILCTFRNESGADLAVTKTLTTAGPFTPGDTVSFDITVTNNGPDGATGVGITDVLSNLESLTFATPSQGSCNDGLGTCSFGAIAADGTATVTVTADITAAGTFQNTVTVSGDQDDAVSGNDSASDGDTAAEAPVPMADLELTKELDTAGPFAPGDEVEFTITVTNNGPDGASNVTVTDTDTNLTVTDVTSSQGGCSSFPCNLGAIANAGSATITVTADIDAVGTFDNEATVSADEADPDTDDNTDNDGGTAESADIDVEKTLNTSGPFSPGDEVEFTVTVTNNGPSTATNVMVTDLLTNLENRSMTPAQGSCDDGAGTCDLGTIANGDSVTITVTADISAAGDFDNYAEASADQDDPTPGNDSDFDGGTAIAADVTLDKTLVTSGPFMPGDTVSFTITVENDGPDTANNVTVTDTPSNLTIQSVSSSQGGCSSFPCNLGTIDNGSSATITVTADIDGPGGFSNSATADADEFDPDTGNNTDMDGGATSGTPTADLELSKTLVTSGPFLAGQSVTYEIVVTNNGPDEATGAQVTDSPTNHSITNVSSSPSGCTTFPCDIGTLASGNSETITVVATIDAAGDFGNQATVSGNEFDPNTGNDTDGDGDRTVSADVMLSKTLDTSGPYSGGQGVTFTIVVSNAGPDTATDIEVTDTPSNISIATVSSFPGGACSSFPCTISSLSSGQSETITVTGTIDAEGAFSNDAAASGTEPDPNPDNNMDGDGGVTEDAPEADVRLTKTLITQGPFSPGQEVTFEILVENLGPDSATDVEVTDTPSNLTITGVSSASCAALPCTIASLAASGSETITVTATIDEAGAFLNSASATGTETDPDPENNDDSDGGNAEAANVSMTKTLDTEGPYEAGQTLTFTLLVENAGPDTATDIEVTDTPSNLTITGVSSASCSALPCTISSLASGESESITVTATIDAAGDFGNEATVEATQFDPDPGDNTDGTEGTALEADVSVVKTLDTDGPFSPGQTVQFTLVVSNAGPDDASDVVVTDTPTNLTIQSVSSTPSDACDALPCTLPSLGSGSSVTIVVTATIDNAGDFENSASVSATEPDPNPDDNTDSDGSDAEEADVSVSKTLDSDGPFSPGDTVTYTITVGNAGPDDATNVVVTDTPTNLTLTGVSSTPTNACTALPCTVPSLAVGATEILTVTATIDAAGDFDNLAEVTADQSDPDPENNRDNDGDGAEEDEADVAVTKTLESDGPYIVSESFVTFEIVVTNNGPATAHNVAIVDTPDNFDISNVASTPEGACTSVPCTLDELASGESVTLQVSGRVPRFGAFSNAVSVSADENDPDLSNNDDDAGAAAEFRAGPVQPIPVLGLPGLILLVLGVAALARRRLGPVGIGK